MSRKFLLPVFGLAMLAACASPTPQQLHVMQVSCQVAGALQPAVVSLAPLAGETGVTVAALDQALVHPFVVAACAQVGGTPAQVAVTP